MFTLSFECMSGVVLDFKGARMNKARSLPFSTCPRDKQVIQCDLQRDDDVLWEHRGGWKSQRGLPGGSMT